MIQEVQLTIVRVRDLVAEGLKYSDEPVWSIEMSKDGSEIPTHGHGFHHSILATRIAEYGLEITDVDTALEMVLCEPYMGSLSHVDPTFVFNVSEEEARNYHLARVSDVRKTVSHYDPNNLLDAVKKRYRPSPVDRELKRDRANSVRAGRIMAIRDMHRPLSNGDDE